MLEDKTKCGCNYRFYGIRREIITVYRQMHYLNASKGLLGYRYTQISRYTK